MLEITEIHGSWTLADLGFTAVFSFTIKARVDVHGESKSIVAGGLERAHGTQGPGVYSQIAFERAAVDLASQVNTLFTQ